MYTVIYLAHTIMKWSGLSLHSSSYNHITVIIILYDLYKFVFSQPHNNKYQPFVFK